MKDEVNAEVGTNPVDTVDNGGPQEADKALMEKALKSEEALNALIATSGLNQAKQDKLGSAVGTFLVSAGNRKGVGISRDFEGKSVIPKPALSGHTYQSGTDVGRCNMTQHRINTGNHPPIKQYPRRLPLAKKEEEKRLVKEMVNNGTIEESSGLWASPIVLVKKKDGSTRFCVEQEVK
ncbi:hypothetical protein AVEN_108539-1 [Araneus ventricosus]|uniref:Reverse transcriptase domain-containing protein n=1 Tax=Araneus ventricosus TaxID=182803 RepID=A0A4Y2M9C4_ARAVE|nr:hypothetical protein AVEN_108539-1 [Araneus ventricosus]